MNGNVLEVPLQPNIGALARYKYVTSINPGSLLSTLFPPGRLLRLANQYGRVAYGYIAQAVTNGGPHGDLPAIQLNVTAPNPSIPLQGAANTVCVFSGVGTEVNVVNFYRYRIASLKTDPTYAATYGQLFASTLSHSNPADANRTELIREELDPGSQTSAPFAQAPEIIAEYAVDLKFDVAATPRLQPGIAPAAFTEPPATVDVYTITGLDATNADSRPQRVRSVRARLSVRSRDADRSANIPGAAAGRYRIGVAPDQVHNFARVRTVQAEIAAPNHFGVFW